MRRLFVVLFGLFTMGRPALCAPIQDCLRDNVEPGLAVLVQMRAAKLNLSKPRLVSQLFYGSSEQKIKALLTLKAAGYIRVTEPPSERLLVTIITPIGDDWVRQMAPQMCSIAAVTGLTYDGWDVDVAADNVKANP